MMMMMMIDDDEDDDGTLPSNQNPLAIMMRMKMMMMMTMMMTMMMMRMMRRMFPSDLSTSSAGLRHGEARSPGPLGS